MMRSRGDPIGPLQVEPEAFGLLFEVVVRPPKGLGQGRLPALARSEQRDGRVRREPATQFGEDLAD